ncbi:MAG TPA: hypothetical protein DCP63_14295 [Bacteroidetes bacterium]|nr:hypothetical protein [Bacteroidota bacterium]
MPADQHHRSKRIRYDLLLVPKDDAGRSTSLRFAPWQVYSLISGSFVFIIISVLAVLIYTPIGTLVPIENPELENRYGKEIIALNQRMTSLVEQLIGLREYNVKLRRALGENAVATDSGIIISASPRETSRVGEQQVGRPPERAEVSRSGISRPLWRSTAPEDFADGRRRVVFPVVMPTEGYLTRGFHPEGRHYGLDIAGRAGTLVNAGADGYVVFGGWTSDDGYKVILSHPGGFLTFYKHNQSLLTSTNSFVRRGEPIALLGNSGQTSAGPHLHFEIWKDGTPVDPAEYILNINF